MDIDQKQLDQVAKQDTPPGCVLCMIRDNPPSDATIEGAFAFGLMVGAQITDEKALELYVNACGNTIGIDHKSSIAEAVGVNMARALAAREKTPSKVEPCSLLCGPMGHDLFCPNA